MMHDVEVDVLRCPVCRDGLAVRATVACAACETAVHADCREFIGGCARFACAEAAGTRRRLVEYLRASSRAEVLRYTIASAVLATFLGCSAFLGMNGLLLGFVVLIFVGFVLPVLWNHQAILLESPDRMPSDRELIHRLQHDSVFRDLDAVARSGAKACVGLTVIACLAFTAYGHLVLALGSAVSALVIWVWCLWWPDFARRRPDRLMSYWKDEIQRAVEATGPVPLEAGRGAKSGAPGTTPPA